jgi:hypothetical protein
MSDYFDPNTAIAEGHIRQQRSFAHFLASFTVSRDYFSPWLYDGI